MPRRTGRPSDDLTTFHRDLTTLRDNIHLFRDQVQRLRTKLFYEIIRAVIENFREKVPRSSLGDVGREFS